MCPHAEITLNQIKKITEKDSRCFEPLENEREAKKGRVKYKEKGDKDT